MTSGQDDGYFPVGSSMLRRVHGERAVGLLYGQRGLMIGALNPLTFVGTVESTYARETPFRRLAHTAATFERIFFGTRAEADEVLAWIRGLHDRVAGTLPEGAGPFPAGTPYSAYDPDLMLWTLAVIADSAETFYDLLVRRLEPWEREALWLDYLRLGELFGMPRDVAPATHAAFRRWWTERLASDEMYLTPLARYVGHATAFEIPVPAVYGPLFRVHNLLMLGSLPARVRELYGLRFTTSQRLAFEAVARAVRQSRLAVPSVVRRGGNSRAFRLVADTEEERIRRGEPTPQIVS